MIRKIVFIGLKELFRIQPFYTFHKSSGSFLRPLVLTAL